MFSLQFAEFFPLKPRLEKLQQPKIDWMMVYTQIALCFTTKQDASPLNKLIVNFDVFGARLIIIFWTKK